MTTALAAAVGLALRMGALEVKLHPLALTPAPQELKPPYDRPLLLCSLRGQQYRRKEASN